MHALTHTCTVCTVTLSIDEGKEDLLLVRPHTVPVPLVYTGGMDLISGHAFNETQTKTRL